MASANMELVRSIMAAWERGDYSSAEWARPEIEFVRVGGPDPGSWTGVVALAERTRDWLGAWKDLRFAADQYREIEGERVLTLVRATGRGKASGVELGQLRQRWAWLFEIEDGKVRRLVFYNDGERALADLGLSPDVGVPSAFPPR